jgi:multidrug/hemolysin transport system permease protein
MNKMKTLRYLVKRNIKLFFKDKGLFFVSLITPLILLVLYVTFLANVYKSNFSVYLEMGNVDISNDMINGFVGGQLFSSLLAVCSITVAFCSNMLMVQDKLTGAKLDFLNTPVKKSILAISYYLATFINTLIICLVATFASFIYIAIVGWYLSFTDCLLIIIDVILACLFSTALSSIVNYFLNSQGQISAVGTIVSSFYGFICGAYMPISTFNIVLQRIITFLPGTYITSLFRNHALSGVLKGMENKGMSIEIITKIKDSSDCNIYFFNHQVSLMAMYLILIISIIVLIGIYILINKINSKKSK